MPSRSASASPAHLLLHRLSSTPFRDKFPLVPITYYDYPEHMVLFDDFPSVCKVSHAHAGMGKSKLVDMTAFRDMSTVLALHQDYCTVEPFIGTL